MKKKCTAPLSIAVMAMSLLTLTSCGNDNDTSVSAMNEIPMPTETSTIEEAISIETEIDTETETITTETTSIEETTTIETDTEIQSETETEEKKETDIDNETSDFEFTISPLSQTMYTQKECNVRKKPSTEYEILDCLNKATEVKVTGKVNEVDWYEVEINSEKGYIAASLLADTKPADQQSQTPPAQTQNPPSQTPPSTGSKPTLPPGWTDNGDGTYTDDNGGTRAINPATGDFYKDGDTTPQGWTYGTW